MFMMKTGWVVTSMWISRECPQGLARWHAYATLSDLLQNEG